MRPAQKQQAQKRPALREVPQEMQREIRKVRKPG